MSEKIQVSVQSTAISVAPAEEARFPITIVNASDIVDRYAIEVGGLPPGWVRILPAAIALLPGESGQATFALHPPADAPAGSYPLSLRATSEQNPAEYTTLSISLTVGMRGSYSLRLAPQEVRTSGIATLGLTASNGGNAPLTLNLSASDASAKARYAFYPTVLRLAPGAEVTSRLEIHLTEPPGTVQIVPFSIVATPEEASYVPQTVQGLLHLMPPARAVLGLSPQQVAHPQQGLFTVRVANPGADPASFLLEGQDPEAACTYAFDPPMVTVPAGGETSSALTVQALAWQEGGVPREINFAVRAIPAEGTAPGTQPEAVTGKLVQQPRPPLTVELVPTQQSAKRHARYRVRLSSSRPDPVAVVLSAADPADALRFNIQPSSAEVRPGSVVEANLSATCKDALPRGQPRKVHAFTVKGAPAQEEPIEVEGKLAQLPGWSIPLPEDPRLRRLLGLLAGLILLFACVLCAVVAPRSCRPTPTPPVIVLSTATPPMQETPTSPCPDVAAPVVEVTPMQVAAVPTTEPPPAAGPLLAPPAVPVLSGGFMDLPFPYDGSTTNYGGTAEQFRRAVNRRVLGGQVTSYFDHEYPLFPWVFQGLKFYGNEPSDAPTGNSVLTFDGTRLSGDWYTGHPGYDFAPLRDAPNSTPIFATGDGVVHRVYVTGTGNHVVELRHYVPGVGNYLTIYMHLQSDTHWNAARARLGQVIRAGERIGTMGNTGKSTGVHLHFEVRLDANGDGEFDKQERVDPFGFVPLQGPDPWAQNVVLRNVQGQQISHPGTLSRYLWRHPLGVTAKVGPEPVRLDLPRGGEDTMSPLSGCSPAEAFPSDSTLVVGWAPDTPPSADQAGTGNGCVVAAFDAQGQPLSQFAPPVAVSIHYTNEQIQDVDPQSLVIYLFDPNTNAWEALPTTIDSANQVATAAFPRPGRCALCGRPTRDLLPPRTTITLEGPRDAQGLYNGDVTVRLSAEDAGDSGVAGIRYSLDFGTTWFDYQEPFVIPIGAERPPFPQGEEEELDTVVQGSGDFLIMARAEDGEGNIEEPPAVAGFSLAEPTPTPTTTGTPPPTDTPTATPTWTLTPTRTRTPTPIPTRTPTPSPTPLQPVIDFRSNVNKVYAPCECAVLTWNVQHVKAVYLGNEGVSGQGEREVCPEETTTYTLRAVPAGGDDITRQVTVGVVYPRVEFRADQSEIASGQSTILRWDVDNVRAVFLDGKPVEGHGTRKVAPSQRQTYDLRVDLVCPYYLDSRELHRYVTITICPPLGGASLLAKSYQTTDGQSAVRAVWRSTGGCGPFTGTLTGRIQGQAQPFQSYNVEGQEGSIDLPPPKLTSEGTTVVVYTLTLRDRYNQTVTTTAEVAFYILL